MQKVEDEDLDPYAIYLKCAGKHTIALSLKTNVGIVVDLPESKKTYYLELQRADIPKWNGLALFIMKSNRYN